ncbi:hypothetical protein [Kitasatospora sp. NBC_00458]|uniref:hypothetical protein n=1 Tax=Kitasatospora sp. NBC_00458 TaxID=2903568 RepID=UPI002E1809E4
MSTRKRNAAAYRPRVGELVLDTRTGRTGIYMDTIGGEHYLRPPDGGREWTADPGHVGPTGAAAGAPAAPVIPGPGGPVGHERNGGAEPGGTGPAARGRTGRQPERNGRPENEIRPRGTGGHAPGTDRGRLPEQRTGPGASAAAAGGW